jgi:hypothetical protein
LTFRPERSLSSSPLAQFQLGDPCHYSAVKERCRTHLAARRTTTIWSLDWRCQAPHRRFSIFRASWPN